MEFHPVSFRKSKNAIDYWRAFCAKHDRYVSQLPRLAPVFASASQFDQFLQSGVHHTKDTMLTIMSLTDAEWTPFSLFVEECSNDLESYFANTMYVAFYREREKREWQPASTGFQRDDLQLPKLIVHFWAPWNTHDRRMDAKLRPAMEHFANQVEFRSLEFDNPQFHDIVRDARIVNVPSLAFYSKGSIDRVSCGVREPAILIDEITAWLGEAT